MPLYHSPDHLDHKTTPPPPSHDTTLSHLQPYIPRCMAGMLLLHVGIDLFIEGVYDSYGKFDALEYSGIWLITVVMVTSGMSAGLLVGLISALFTYVYQSSIYVNPLRGYMTATTLRSRRWRHPEAERILADRLQGRHRILVLQLQGNLFFGNIVALTDKVKEILRDKSSRPDDNILIAMLDFALVTGMDSSAAQSISKLKSTMHEQYGIRMTVFVTGRREGFPCEYDLTRELLKSSSATDSMRDDPEPGEPPPSPAPRQFSQLSSGRRSFSSVMPVLVGDRVMETLDEALAYCEDLLVRRRSPGLESSTTDLMGEDKAKHGSIVSVDAGQVLQNLLPRADPQSLEKLLSFFQKETWRRGECLWRQGSVSTSLKLVTRGLLESILEDEAGTTEDIHPGAMIGEVGLVNGVPRFSTVVCKEDCVLYSLSDAQWLNLTQSDPALARIIDLIVIRYLSHRLQHVSNRIFETRCVPI
mmetsp:Transcript_32229/g.74217  ORF Transcript_32229/g.74217 Transcript_32229/m.74217 type:complete len:473 (-) Transcript_32229:320-1738(-)